MHVFGLWLKPTGRTLQLCIARTSVHLGYEPWTSVHRGDSANHWSTVQPIWNNTTAIVWVSTVVGPSLFYSALTSSAHQLQPDLRQSDTDFISGKCNLGCLIMTRWWKWELKLMWARGRGFGERNGKWQKCDRREADEVKEFNKSHFSFFYIWLISIRS